ncbi:MAG TPA: hypothetical protein VNQ53_10695 [Nocardioides sp.]|nr:hypothetical protein [Nocardioides sp.]
MFIRPRTLVPVVVVAFFLLGAAACSNGQASVTEVGDSPSSEDTDPTSDEASCAATATANGKTYHVVQAVSEDYSVKPTRQVDGSATDCTGGGEHPMTFHPIPDVDPTWALCGLVEGQWRVFVADDLGPVPQDSHLARIVVGD